MLRVGDCPCDPMSNRRAIIDLRLISGETAVHSDMLMWNKTDTPESAALQLGSVLFAVPQISVRLHELSGEHRKLLAHYLDFWTAHRDVLLGGKLYARDPGALYSSAYAEKDGEAVWVSYEDPVVLRVAEATSAVNCSAREHLYFEGFAGKNYTVVNCTGDEVSRGTIKADLEKIAVPAGGIAFIS